MDKKHCIGCENNFYNGNNPYGVQECWGLKEGKLISRYQLSVNTPMDRKSGYLKVKKPNCYRKKGYVHLEKIPSYAK